MSQTNPQVDPYFNNAKRWRDELRALRAIVLACDLTEELKWRAPCYTHDGRNVAMIAAFKDYCGLSIFKGALLKDAQGVLVKPGENTQAARVAKFTDVREIAKLAPTLKAYLREAIDVERAGLKVEPHEARAPELPEELLAKFAESAALKRAFDALTPGRQRAYLMHFSAAKQSTTRTSRIEKFIPQILAGKGMHDCTCGLTRKPPACDGSHKSHR
ncbi:MAG: YdeI/OmpD-associated family protein [Planctomycetales bacterium]|nr:YdeI/OmpD-associated family protein [Planctomycetales bacterium]